MSLLPSSSSSDAIEAQVHHDLAGAFRARLHSDSTLVLLGHLFLVLLVTLAFQDASLGTGPIVWLVVVVLVTVARAAWQRSVAGFAHGERWMFTGTRALVLLHGLSWGVGAAVLLPAMEPNDRLIVLVGIAGIVASAIGTLVADQASFRCFVAGMLGPVVIRLLTSGGQRHDLMTAALVVAYAVSVLLLHSRSHRALAESLRTTVRLTLSHQETAREHAYLFSLLQTAPVAIAVLDNAKRIRSVNARFEALFGYTAQEAVGRQLDDLLVPAEGLDEHSRLTGCVRQGGIVEAEVQRRTKNGETIRVRLSAAAVADPTMPGMVVMYEDVTQQRLAEEARREREARLSRLVDSNIMGIGFWEASGCITEANDEYLRIIGYDREDLNAGRVNFRAFSPPEYAVVNQRALVQMAQGTTVPPWEAEVIRKDGRQIPIVVGVAPLNDRRDRGVVFLLDITDRKGAEEQAKYRAAMLEAQVNTSIDGILIVDAQGKTVLTNQRMAEIWGIPPAIAQDEDDSKRLQFVVQQAKHPDTFLAKVEYLYAHPGEASKDEVELNNGTVLDRYSAPVIGEGGGHYGRIWTFHDVTESKRAQQAMSDARDLAERAAESRAMFLANMSHEIRTPMNAVLGMIEIVLDTDLTAEQRHFLGLASSSAESLLGTLNDVLDFSKIEAGRLDVEAIPFDLQRLIQSIASLLALRAAQKDLELITDVAPEVPGMVRGDPSRLRQILTNLIGNAIKFTDRGEIIIGVRPEAMADGRPGVLFSVRDTGVGIVAEKLADIFEEFTQADGSTSRRFGGTGLGLTISQRLAWLMGGRITVTSEVGRGSEFRFTLPLVAEPVPMPAVSAKSDSLTGRFILVVDDRPINRRICEEMLMAAGARVEGAEDAASALARLRAACDAGSPASLAIVDVQMPGQDGYELASQIRGDPTLAATPLLMLTSAGRRGDAARCRELGVAGYLTKPVSRSDLLETVAAILEGGGAWSPQGSIITRHSLAEARESVRILVAEDNPVNQDVAATMLRRRGHRVDLAGNGREAIAAVRNTRYDVVLMDIQMPEVDGFEATAAIRELPGCQDLPIIALTAHAFSAERERCLAAGMNGFLSKPFRAQELFAVVEGRGAGSSRAPAESPRVVGPVPVDLDTLRRQLHEAGAEAALDGIVDTFLESVPERVTTLHKALTRGSPAEVATAAHALKSSAGVIGAVPLAELLAEIEAAGRADTLSDTGALAERVQRAASAVLTDLRSYRGIALDS